MKLEATFEITNWDEKPFDETDGVKLTQASVRKTFAGDIDGEAVLDYLMSYAPDGAVAFVGMERVTGTAGGRKGTLVLQQVGTFVDGAAKASLTVVAGSGGLAGATGTGHMVADPSGRVTLDLS